MKKFDLQQALEKRRIVPFSNAPKLISKELKAAREDLKDAYDNFIQALSLREMADYKSKYSKHGADRNIQAAAQAIKLAEKILQRR